MRRSASQLSEKSRSHVATALYQSLTCGIDLFTQIKVAHWNIRGPHFASLHPLFDTMADGINDANDQIAERAIILGGSAYATARQVAQGSS